MAENKSLKLSFDVIGGDFERAGEASAKIKKMLKMIGVPADIVRRIAIGTYEAEVNAIIPDIEKALQEVYSTAPDHVRQMGFGAGMGLPNMVKCSDEFDIKSVVGEGTTITMRFEHISEDL